MDYRYLGFQAFDPPALETFARHWRQKAYHNMDKALEHHRLDFDRPLMYWHLGMAHAAVLALYDINHPGCYHAMCRYNLVTKIIKDGTH